MWLAVPVNNPDRLALTLGRWSLSLDNTILGIKPDALDGIGTRLPVSKTWQGKAWDLTGARVSPDGRRLWFDVTVKKNPLPLIAVCAGLGIVGVVALVFLVRELRRWLPIGDLTRSALPYVAGGLVALFFVVLLVVRAFKGKG